MLVDIKHLVYKWRNHWHREFPLQRVNDIPAYKFLIEAIFHLFLLVFVFFYVCFLSCWFFLSCYEVNFHRSLSSLLKLSLVHVYTYHVVILGEMLQVLAQQERVSELWFHICETDGREDICFLHRKETFCHKFYGRCCF